MTDSFLPVLYLLSGENHDGGRSPYSLEIGFFCDVPGKQFQGHMCRKILSNSVKNYYSEKRQYSLGEAESRYAIQQQQFQAPCQASMCFLGFREKAAFLSNYLISFLALPEAVPVHSRLPPPPPLSNSFPGSSRVSLSDLFSRFSQASLFSLYCPYLGFCCACSQ